MKKRSLLALFATLLLLPFQVWSQSRSHHVVFAVSSANQPDWMLTVGNIMNVRKGFAPEAVDIEVVAFGPGIAMVKKDSPVVTDIEALEKDGVRFVACENSMRRMHLAQDDLATGVGTVPSGVVEIIKKQEAGWSYVKAGQ